MTKTADAFWLSIVAFCLALVAACTPTDPEPRQITWRLEQDVAAFREAYAGQPEMIYRVAELAVAVQSSEYQTFLAALNRAPHAARAFVYYESAPNASHYLFALAARDGQSCLVVVSDLNGVREHVCRDVPEYRAEIPGDEEAIRDPGVAGLAQFNPSDAEPRRAMSVLPADEPAGLARDDLLFDKVERIFGN